MTYYRLRQTDYDGKYEYFTPVAVTPCPEGIDGIIIYPNPAIDNINIIVASSVNSEGVATITDVLGRKVLEHKITLHKGKNNFSFNLPSLGSGSYILQVSTESDIYRTQQQFVQSAFR